MATITLTDGRTITGLRRNGNNFIADLPIEETLLEENTANLTIIDGSTTETMTNAYLVQQVQYPDGWHIVFAEKSEAELLREQLAEVQLALIELYEGMEG